MGDDDFDPARTARVYVPPPKPTGKQLPGSTALTDRGRQQQAQQKQFLYGLAAKQAKHAREVPRRSRARHLSPSARRDWSDPLLGGEPREKRHWYEQRSLSKSTSRLPVGDVSQLDVSRPLTCLSHDFKGTKVLGAETPFFGSKIDPGPPVWSAVPKAVPPALRLQLERSGNWPLPDTPRCAAMLVAERAAREAAEAKRRKLAEMEAHYQAKVRARKSVIAVMATTGIVQDAPPAAAADAAAAEEPRPATSQSEQSAESQSDAEVSPAKKASALAALGGGSPKKAVAFGGAPKKKKGSMLSKFKKAGRMSAMMGRMVAPDRKGHAALLELKMILAEEAHRHLLWHWRTVVAIFRAEEPDVEALPWPYAPASAIIALPKGKRSFDNRSPIGTLRAKKIGDMLRFTGLSDINCVRLVEARIHMWVDAICTRDADGDGEDDGEWTLRPPEKEEDELDWDDESDAGALPREQQPVAYEVFKNYMFPSKEDLKKIWDHHNAWVKRQAADKARRDARIEKRRKKQREQRKWALAELEAALDDWPPRIRKGQPPFSTKERHAALEFVMDAGQGEGKKAGLAAAALGAASGLHHVRLRAPGMREALVNCCLEGIGYGGLSAVEIVETFRVYCVERLQAKWRGRAGGRKFAKARELWRRRDLYLLRIVTRAWREDARKMALLRRACLRKVVGWRWWAKGRVYRKMLFRVCFWPLRTWRIMARARLVAREKAKFLRLVWRSLVKRRHCKAWFAYASVRVERKKRADAHYRSYLMNEARLSVACWLDMTQQRRALRRAWLSRPVGGAALLRKRTRGRASRALSVWKYWTYLAKHCRVRAASWFRRIKTDDDARRALAKDAKRARGARRRGLQKDLKEMDDTRAKPPPLPLPDDATCFAPAPNPDEDARKDRLAAERSERADREAQRKADFKKKCKRFAALKTKTKKQRADEKQRREAEEDRGAAVEAFEAALLLLEKLREERKPKSTLSEDERRLCLPLIAYFEGKAFPRELAACWMRYWRCGQAALSELKEFAHEKRKDNRADLLYAKHVRRRVFKAWIGVILEERAEAEAEAAAHAKMLERAKENAKKQRLKDKHEKEQAEKAEKEKQQHLLLNPPPPPDKSRKSFTAKQIFGNRVTTGHVQKDKGTVAPIDTGNTAATGSTSPTSGGTLETASHAEPASPSHPAPAAHHGGGHGHHKKHHKHHHKKKKSKKEEEAAFDPYADDRNQRALQAKRVEASLAHARELATRVRATASVEREADKRNDRFKSAEQAEIQAFLNDKDEQLASAKEKADQHISEFAEHAARKMVETVHRIRREAALAYDRQLLKHALRVLRLPWAEKRSAALMRRQILRNRLAICARYRQLDRGMPRFRRLRVKWVVWNTWLKLLSNHYVFRSPHINSKLVRRRDVALRATALLRERGAARARTIPGDAFADLRGCFCRWACYVMNRIRWREMRTLGELRLDLRTKTICFMAFRREAGFGDAEGRSPLLRRCEADLCEYAARFVATRRKRDLLRQLRASNAIHAKAVRDKARNGPSFRKFLGTVRKETELRLLFEQKLLLDAFEIRGTVTCEDHDVPMELPINGGGELLFKDPVAPPGSKIGAIAVFAKRGHGVLGIGATVQADGDAATMPFHGGSSGLKETFELKQGEALSAIELTLSPSVIEAVRFEASVFGNVAANKKTGGIIATMFENKRWMGLAKTKSRWSKWFGSSVSSDARTVVVRGPPETAIVALLGTATTSRVVGLGVVYRTIQQEGVFSPYWTAPLRLSRADAATALPPIDGKEKPAAAPPRARSSSREKQKIVSHALEDGGVATGEEQHVLEFVTVLRYRRVDALNAVARAEIFARRVWSSRIVRMRRHLKPLCTITIVMGLAKWLFSALAAPLVPLAPENDDVAAQLDAAFKRIFEAETAKTAAAKKEAAVLARIATHNRMVDESARRPRTPKQRMLNASRVMMSPQWRTQETVRLLKDDHDLATAASDHALACVEAEAGVRDTYAAKAKAIRVDPRAPRVRRCYTRLVALARRQLQLQKDWGADHFLDTLNATTVSEQGGAMPRHVFEAVMETLVVRKANEDAQRERDAEEEAAAELRRLSAPDRDDDEDSLHDAASLDDDDSDDDSGTHDTAAEAAFQAALVTDEQVLS